MSGPSAAVRERPSPARPAKRQPDRESPNKTRKPPERKERERRLAAPSTRDRVRSAIASPEREPISTRDRVAAALRPPTSTVRTNVPAAEHAEDRPKKKPVMVHAAAPVVRQVHPPAHVRDIADHHIADQHIADHDVAHHGARAPPRSASPPAKPAAPHRAPAAHPLVDRRPAGAELVTSTRILLHRTGYTLSVAVVAGLPHAFVSWSRTVSLKTILGTAAKAAVHGAHRGPLLRRLATVDHVLNKLHDQWRAAHASSVTERKRLLDTGLRLVARYLQRIGRDFHIDDLTRIGHASSMVDGHRLLPQWAVDVRRWAYPKGPVSIGSGQREAMLRRLRNPRDPTRFRDESTRRYERVAEVSVEHKPRVVEHWNTAGNATGPRERDTFYTERTPERLQLVARKNNSADGPGVDEARKHYRPTVGPDFLGPLDEK